MVTAAVRDGVVTLTGQLATNGKDELQRSPRWSGTLTESRT